MAAVAQLVRGIQPTQDATWLPGNDDGAIRHPLELAGGRCCDICPILLDLQLSLNADVFEIVLDQLRGIEDAGAVAPSSMEPRLKPFGKASICQQAPRLLWIVLIVLCPCAKLIDG
jgi:hypothetical protein